MRDTIFKTSVEMPSKEISSDVVGPAMTVAEVHKNYMPAIIPTKDASVQNIERPRRGYGY